MHQSKSPAAEAEAVAKLHGLIRNFYMVATLGKSDYLEDRALELLCASVSLDAVMFVRLDPAGVELHDYRMRGLSASFMHAYRRTLTSNPLLFDALATRAGHTRQLTASNHTSRVDPSPFHDQVLPHHGIGEQLNFSYRDIATNALYVLHAYRFRGAPLLTEHDAWIACNCLPHLATSHGQALILKQALTHDRVVFHPTALCDARGIFYFVQDEFVALLREQYPDWDGHQIPFDLPYSPGVSEFMVGDLSAHVTPHGDLSIVRLWRRPTTDFLSRRECEIAKLVTAGLPNKAIARRLEVAPSTVGNHLQSIFRKLGISSRAELKKLME